MSEWTKPEAYLAELDVPQDAPMLEWDPATKEEWAGMINNMLQRLRDQGLIGE